MFFKSPSRLLPLTVSIKSEVNSQSATLSEIGPSYDRPPGHLLEIKVLQWYTNTFLRKSLKSPTLLQRIVSSLTEGLLQTVVFSWIIDLNEQS